MTDEEPIIITDPDKIRGVRLLAMHHAMKLEALGLHHSSGRSVTALVKREFGLKGNRARVMVQFAQILRERGILAPAPAPTALRPKGEVSRG